MRGKVKEKELALRKERITPAYAGKSLVPPFLPRYLEDHPRLCGEKCAEFKNVAAGMESPPPMRGKVCHDIF